MDEILRQTCDPPNAYPKLVSDEDMHRDLIKTMDWLKNPSNMKIVVESLQRIFEHKKIQ